jgi:hypothetical protein
MDPMAFATAYALSTSIGLRPFLTLALASLAMHFGYLHPAHTFAYLGTDGATAVLGVLAALEFAGDKIPLVDHTLHVLHVATKPIAAALLVGSVVPDIGPSDAFSYALMGAGAVNALGVHAGVATLRGASSATTAGLANPFISFVEDGLTLVATAGALFAPFLAAGGALALTIVIVLLARSIVRAARRPATAVSA